MVKRLAVAFALTVGMISTALAHGHHGHLRHHYAARHYQARPRRHYARHRGDAGAVEVAGPLGSNAARARAEGLPWCGAFMADLFHKTGASARELWLARNWAREGVATRPHPGAVIVWAHHVGKLIRQVSGSVWIVLSGNDGHRVRERARSIGGAIAFRDL